MASRLVRPGPEHCCLGLEWEGAGGSQEHWLLPEDCGHEHWPLPTPALSFALLWWPQCELLYKMLPFFFFLVRNDFPVKISANKIKFYIFKKALLGDFPWSGYLLEFWVAECRPGPLHLPKAPVLPLENGRLLHSPCSLYGPRF